jgi:hypothetical protein
MNRETRSYYMHLAVLSVHDYLRRAVLGFYAHLMRQLSATAQYNIIAWYT